MIIRTNMSAMFAYRSLMINQQKAAQAMRRLSSGYRINSAADDPAGLAVSEKMRAQIRGLNMAAQNSRHAISMLQTAEGGLNETHAILQRMRELAVQASNGTYDNDDRANLSKEYEALKEELTRISSYTNYNGIKLLDGSAGGVEGTAAKEHLGITDVNVDSDVRGTLKFNIREDEPGVKTITLEMDGKTVEAVKVSGSDTSAVFQTSDGDVTLEFDSVSDLKGGVISGIKANGSKPVDFSGAKAATTKDQLYFQIGANGGADQRIGVSINDMSAGNIGDIENDKSVHQTDILSQENARDAIDSLEKAIKQVAGERAGIGAQINRLEHTINNLENTAENLTAAESAIRDADMAQEMMNFVKYSILMQVAQAMMAQAMNLPKGILTLLQSL